MAWSEWGRPDGLPVLFCTGAALSGSLDFGARDLPDLGLRLLASDRPGLGWSDPDPGKTLASWVEDIRELVEAEGLGVPLAVGSSQGAPFAFALAGGGLVGALSIVSGQDQLARSEPRPLPVHSRMLLRDHDWTSARLARRLHLHRRGGGDERCGDPEDHDANGQLEHGRAS